MADSLVKQTSSLSRLPTYLVGSSFKDKYILGQIIVDIIFGVATGGFFVLTLGPKKIFEINPESIRGLVLGIVALLIWYLMTVVDLFLHEAGISVPYNYFFIAVPIKTFKFCAEGFLTATAYRLVVLHLQQHNRRAKLALVFGEVLNLSLIVTAIYAVGSLIARQVVWLQLAEEQTRRQFAVPQRKFEAAFYCIQFCMGFLATVFAGLNAWMIHHSTGHIPVITSRLFWGTVSFWIWTTSEMAFVVKYDLGDRALAKDTGLARDTIYGLFTVIFFVLFAFDGTVAGKGPGNNDRTTNAIRLPTYLHPMLAEMKASCRNYIINQVQARVRENEKPPPFIELARELRQSPTTPFSRKIRDERTGLDVNSRRLLDDKYGEYVADLETRYGTLQGAHPAREV